MCEKRPFRILIYQNMWGHSPNTPSCGCEFIYDRSRWQDADAVVFHVPQLKESRFPPRKLKGQYWIAWCMESETNYPILSGRSDLGAVFDLWMTYQQDSDVWCPYISAEMVKALKTPPLKKTARSLAVALMSSRFDQSRRTALLAALLQEMPVDSYGKMPSNQAAKIGPGRSAKQALIAQYKFTLAFENSICKDYVTEKFFDPLLVGSVPVYLGAPNVEEFAPGKNCYIDATRFDSPRKLAGFLVELAANEEAYARHLQWKSEPLSPRFVAMIEKTTRGPFHRLVDLLQHMRLRGEERQFWNESSAVNSPKTMNALLQQRIQARF